MTYIGYLNRFWSAQEEYMFSAATIALYAYLLNECNRRNWKMPFACSTVIICEKLRISKQTLSAARMQLAEARLIEFTDGKSRFTPSKYTLLNLTDNLAAKRTDNLTLFNTKDKDKRQHKREKVIPTVADIESYMAQCMIPNGYELRPGLPQRFYDYYESKGWLVVNSPMTDWQATARKWTQDTQNIKLKNDETDKRKAGCGCYDNRAEARCFIEELEKRSLCASNRE